jgi:hypothetical protein
MPASHHDWPKLECLLADFRMAGTEEIGRLVWVVSGPSGEAIGESIRVGAARPEWIVGRGEDGFCG